MITDEVRHGSAEGRVSIDQRVVQVDEQQRHGQQSTTKRPAA
jgi:hypothetical protein